MPLGARVFVAAEDPLLRSALRLLLEHEEGVSVVGEGGEPTRLLEEVRGADADLVLLTWSMARGGAPNLIASLKEMPSHPRVIALNCCPRAASVVGRAGVDELVRKGESPERLLAAVRSTMWTQ